MRELEVLIYFLSALIYTKTIESPSIQCVPCLYKCRENSNDKKEGLTDSTPVYCMSSVRNF